MNTLSANHVRQNRFAERAAIQFLASEEKDNFVKVYDQVAIDA